MADNRRTGTGAPPLPQELVDHIIDLVAASTDRAALGACALTARRWTHRARTHLHHTLTLRHRTYHVHPRARVSSAQRALDPAVRGALPYVRVLHLRGESSNLCFHSDADACDSKEAGAVFWEVLEAVMDAAAERVDAERGRSGVGLSLKVTDLYCGDARPEDTERLCAALRVAGSVGTIAQVEMADCEFRCPGELRRVLQACGRFATLKLDWIFWAQDAADSWGARIYNRSRGRLSTPATATRATSGTEEELLADFGSLTHLQVGHCSSGMDENIVKMFIPAREPSCVRQLSLGPADLDIEALPVWVRAVGESVEHLRLSFGQIGHPEVVNRVVGCLQHCAKLRKITLCATPRGSSAAPCNPHFWLCALEVLQAVLVHAQDLEVIEFVCPRADTKTEGQEDCAKEDMDRLLARLRERDTCGPKFAVIFIEGVESS